MVLGGDESLHGGRETVRENGGSERDSERVRQEGERDSERDSERVWQEGERDSKGRVITCTC